MTLFRYYVIFISLFRGFVSKAHIIIIAITVPFVKLPDNEQCI